jgi:hypothetical protein
LKCRSAFCGLRRIFHGLVFARYENQTALIPVAQSCSFRPRRLCQHDLDSSNRAYWSLHPPSTSLCLRGPATSHRR